MEAGFGKSSLCAVLFDDPAFFQWEKGQNALRTKKVEAPDWKSFTTNIRALQQGAKTGKKMPFSTAIMDVVDIAYSCCTDKVCLDNGWTHPSEGDYGKGWAAVRGEFEGRMKNLEDLGISPVYVSHVKDKEFKPKKGEKFDKIVPSSASQTLDTVVGKVDFVGYCVFEKVLDEDGNEKVLRRIYFRSDGDFEAKARLLFFPDFIEYGNSPEEAAYNIRKAFDEAVFKEFNIEVNNAGKLSFSNKFPKAETKKQSPKAEPAKEQPKVDKKQDNVVEKVNIVEQDTNNDLEKIIEEVQKIFTQLLKDKIITAQQVVSILKEQTGCSKFGQIQDIEKAKELLIYANNLQ